MSDLKEMTEHEKYIDRFYDPKFTAYDFMRTFCISYAIIDRFEFYRNDLLHYIKICKKNNQFNDLLEEIYLKSNGIHCYSEDLEEAMTKLKFGGILYTISPERDSKIYIHERIPLDACIETRDNLEKMTEFIESFDEYTLQHESKNKIMKNLKKLFISKNK